MSPRSPLSLWTRRLLLAAAALAGCYLIYGRLHISVLRAESGVYLERGAASAAELLGFAAANFARSYNGHYTPFAFDVELAWAALFGPSEAWWRLRQMIYLSVFVLGAFSFWKTIAGRLGAAPCGRLCLGLGGAALFVCSPLLIELMTWPFMGMQILWAGMTMWSLRWLQEAVAEEAGDDGVSFRALGISLAFAYGSLHCLGLGLATMAGYIAVVGLLLGVAWVRGARAAHFRRLVCLGGLAVALAVAHGCMMILTLPPEMSRARSPGDLIALLGQTLGYVACVVFACARSLWSPNAWPWPHIDLLAHDWPYGAGALLLASLYLWHLWERWRAGAGGGDGRTLGQLCGHVFSCAAFGFGVLMIAGRVWKGEPWLGYLIGSRYLWPFSVLLAGTLGSLALHLRLRDRLAAPALGLALAGVCATGNLVYQRQIAPALWPGSMLSHEAVWRELVAMTGELQAAQLPVPDLLMQRLGEFQTTLRAYESLLRRSRGLLPKAGFVWVEPATLSAASWEEMKQRSPSLTHLSQTIFVDTDRALRAGTTVPVREARNGMVIAVLTDPPMLRSVRLDHVKDQPNLGVPIDVGGVTKPSIWIDPPTALTYPALQLGQRTSLRCAVAIHPLIWNSAGADGAVFRVGVRVNGETVILSERYLNPTGRPQERCWNLFEVDLSKYAGRKVDLVLDNTAGPAGNDYGDWCIWGDVVLVERR